MEWFGIGLQKLDGKSGYKYAVGRAWIVSYCCLLLAIVGCSGVLYEVRGNQYGGKHLLGEWMSEW